MAELKLSDGLMLAYDDVGRGRPLLLVHGWGAHAGFFEPLRAALSNRFRVVTPDLRGHGRTPADGAMTVDRLAQDVAELIAALDLTDAVGVGWSLGAMVLWSVLEGPAHPRFAGLAIIDMTPRIIADGGWPHGIKGGYDSSTAALAQRAMLADWPGFSRAMAGALVAEGAQADRKALIDFSAGEFARNRPKPLAELWASLAAKDYRETVRGLHLPALVAMGARSQLYTLATGADLTARLPDATQVVFAQSGHALHLEEPERFNTVLAEFADALPRAGQPQSRRPTTPPIA